MVAMVSIVFCHLAMVAAVRMDLGPWKRVFSTWQSSFLFFAAGAWPMLVVHSGPEGSLSQQKLIIYMSYISKKVMKNAIQIHWNQNWALRDFNVMVIYFHLYHGYPQWILRIWEVFPLLYSRLKNYPHSVIHIMKGIIEAYLKM